MYGGSSSHNYALIVKVSSAFYNGSWREQLGLSYEELQPHFDRIDQKIVITPLPVSLDILPRIGPTLSEAVKEGPGVLLKGIDVATHLVSVWTIHFFVSVGSERWRTIVPERLSM
jgi:hypothetical protein